jgi:hypothetical protein
VVLAEGVKEAYDAKEAYRYGEDGVETIGWYFAATLRQTFEYAEYPFDQQDVWLAARFLSQHRPGARFRLVQHHFWRVLLGLLLAVTLIVFFRT